MVEEEEEEEGKGRRERKGEGDGGGGEGDGRGREMGREMEEGGRGKEREGEGEGGEGGGINRDKGKRRDYVPHYLFYHSQVDIAQSHWSHSHHPVYSYSTPCKYSTANTVQQGARYRSRC